MRVHYHKPQNLPLCPHHLEYRWGTSRSKTVPTQGDPSLHSGGRDIVKKEQFLVRPTTHHQNNFLRCTVPLN